MTVKAQKSKNFTAKKAQFLNLSEDGIKLRAGAFKRKDTYNKKDKSWKRNWDND